MSTRANINAGAQAVLELRAGKDMLLDPYVFGAGQGEPAAEPTYNRWSAGSFFTNPILAAGSKLPEGAPTYPVHTAVPAATTGPSNGTIDPAVVKTSAAWLIAPRIGAAPSSRLRASPKATPCTDPTRRPRCRACTPWP